MSEPASSPRVSVLMPVHNAVAYLGEALESIAAQTWTDFEVVAVDDASTDGSGAKLSEHARRWPWLRVILRPARGGVAVALNTGFSLCEGELIARMDADDVCMPERFARQVAFMDAHPDVGVCGGAVRVFGGGRMEVVKPPTDDDAIRAWLVFGSAFIHPAVMFRRSVVRQMDGPYAPVVGVEDYDLWLRLAAVTRFGNLPEELLRYRVHPGQYSANKKAEHQRMLDEVRMEWLRARGIRWNDVEREAHVSLAFDRPARCDVRARAAVLWLRRLLREVPASGWCGESTLREMVGERWWAWVAAERTGLAAAGIYGCGPVARHGRLEVRRILRLAASRGLRD